MAKTAQGSLVLDHVQAQYIADVLVEDTDSLEIDLKNLRDELVKNLEAIVTQAINQTKVHLYTLPPDEIDAVMNERGLTPQKLVEQFEQVIGQDDNITAVFLTLSKNYEILSMLGLKRLWKRMQV